MTQEPRVRFNASREDYAKIRPIVDRALLRTPNVRKVDLVMDLDACHSNGNPLDFDKLLQFDDLNFFHDITGIMRNIDRTTGQLKGGFAPRCSITFNFGEEQ